MNRETPLDGSKNQPATAYDRFLKDGEAPADPFLAMTLLERMKQSGQSVPVIPPPNPTIPPPPVPMAKPIGDRIRRSVHIL